MNNVKREHFLLAEKAVMEQIVEGLRKGRKKKRLMEEVAHDLFLEYFPDGGAITGKGFRLCLHIMKGAVRAAEKESANKPDKALKHTARGLVYAIGERGWDFRAGAAAVMQAAVLCAHETGMDLHLLVRRALEGVVEACLEKDLDHVDVVRLAAEAALGAVELTDEKDVAALEQIFLKCLSGSCGEIEPIFQKRKRGKLGG